MNHLLELALLFVAAVCAVATLVRAKSNLVAWGLLSITLVLVVPLLH